VPRRVDAHGDTFASLRFELDDPPATQWSTPDAFCIDGDLAVPFVRTWRGSGIISDLFMQGGQVNLWMSLAEDGSLIVRFDAYDGGLVVVVPYFVCDGGWARFTRIGPKGEGP
jgi:hypothetical protein